MNKLTEDYMQVNDEIEKIKEMINVLKYKSDTCTHIDVYVRGERQLNVMLIDDIMVGRALEFMLQDLNVREEQLFQKISEERRK